MARLAAAFVAVLLIAAAPSYAAPDPAVSLLQEINAVRAKQGLKPVRREARLDRAARAHSKAMAEQNFFDHRGRDGKKVADRLAMVGYGFQVVGENIAAGMESPATVVKQWLLSRGHRENLLEPRATEAGIGYVAVSDDKYRHYWTFIVAEPAKP